MSVRLHICTCVICVLNTRVGVAKKGLRSPGTGGTVVKQHTGAGILT